MIVALDTNCLITWSGARDDDPRRARLEHLLETISAASGRVVIATHCLAEYLVHLGPASTDWLANLERRRSVVVAAFDRRAAFECALMDRAAIRAGDKKAGRKDAWQRIKIDRQILAIAKVNGATQLVTDDEGLKKLAKAERLIVRSVAELELPESARQQKLKWEVPADANPTSQPVARPTGSKERPEA